MFRDPFTVEYTTLPGDDRRRVRFEPIAAADDLWYRIEEQFTADGWRECGRETVDDVIVQTNDETVIPRGNRPRHHEPADFGGGESTGVQDL